MGFRLGGNLGAGLLGLFLGIIMARLLPPHEFGLFGVGLSIVVVADILSAAGMFQALLQRKHVTPEDEATGFFLQLAGALVMGGALVALGPLVERFFAMPGLGTLVQFQALALLLRTLGLIPGTRLQRRLAFDRLAFAEVVSRSLGGVVGVIFAFQGQGALALTAGSLTSAGTKTAIIWMFASGRIPLTFSVQSARSLLGFGTGMLFIRVCNDFAHRIDIFVIGRQLGPAVVGLYQRAYQLMTLPLTQFTNTINQVLFPAMALVQSDNEKFRRGYLGSVALSGMVAFPMLTLLWVAGDILIPFLYGPKWGGTVPVLTILAFVGYLRVINNPNGLVTQSRAFVMAEGWRQALFTIVTGVAVFIGTHWGLIGAAFGIVAAAIIYLAVMTRLALRIAELSFTEWLSSLRTVVLSTVVMSVTGISVKWTLARFLSPFAALFVITAVSLAAYLVALRFLLSPEERRILGSVASALPGKAAWAFRFVIRPEPKPEKEAPLETGVEEGEGITTTKTKLISR